MSDYDELLKICYRFANEFFKFNENRIIKPKLKILYAEDNPVSQKLFLQMFKKYPDILVSGVVDGFDAEKSAKEDDPYDIIFLDVQMPGKSGIEVCKLLREYESKKIIKPTKIVIITSDSSYEDASYDAGCDFFILKENGYKVTSMLPVINTLTGYKF